MDVQKVGSFIAAMRRERGLTQKDLGRQLHVSDRAVSKWERGVNLPDAALFEPLCRALGITLIELFHGEREEDAAFQVEQVVGDAVLLACDKEHKKKNYQRTSWLLLAALFLILLPAIEKAWNDYQMQQYFDQNTVEPIVTFYYREDPAEISTSSIVGGRRIPRADGGYFETAPTIQQPVPEGWEGITTLDTGFGEGSVDFVVNMEKSVMELQVLRWPLPLRGSVELGLEDGEKVGFQKKTVFWASEKENGTRYSFEVSPGWLYSVVVSWGDGFYREYSIQTK